MTAVASPECLANWFPGKKLDTAVGQAWVVESADEIPQGLRHRAFTSRSKDFRYYEVLESTLTEQFEYRYLLLHDPDSGECAVQPVFFVEQDPLAGLPAGLRALFDPIRRRWPGFLILRMLMVGCAAGEGELDHPQPWLPAALHAALEAYRRQAGAAIILLKDFPSTYRRDLANFEQQGYQRAPSMPAAELRLDFASFEDFMTHRLGKVFRKNLRRKFKALRTAPEITMEVRNDAGELAEQIYQLHLQTFSRSKFTFEKLNKEYFEAIGKRMPDRVRFFLWWQEGRLIGFNLCLLHDDVLHDLDLGLDYTVALDLHLYFVTWRDVITWCLENGVKTYHTGPLNYDPKLHLKMQLAPQDLYARYNSDWINPIFKLAIKYLEPTRWDPVLRRFANAAELYS